MKKQIMLGLVSILLISGLAACGHSSGNTSPETSPEVGTASDNTAQSQASNEMKKFTVWSRDTEDSIVGKAFASDIAAFKELHPELEIDHLSIPHADVVTKWNTAFAGGTAPDVIDVGVSHIVQRVQLGHIIPLDEYYANWDKKEDVASGMVDYGVYDDELYAIAYNAAPPIMAWRKDYFEEAGLDPEQPPKDWAQMLEYADKLTVKDGDKIVRAGLELPDTRGASILFQLFMQNDVETIDYAGDKPNFNQPGAIEAGQFLLDLVPHSILKAADGTGVFIAGASAMTLTIGPEALDNMLVENPELDGKLGVTSSLTNKKGGMHAGAWLYAISSQTKNPDLAWEYIDFIFTPERCKARMDEVGMVPPIHSLSEEYVSLNPQFHEAQLMNLVQSQAYPKTAWTNLYEENLHRAYEQIIYAEKTPEQALVDTEAEIISKK